MIVLMPMHNTYVPHLFVNPCSAIGSYKEKERMYSMKKKKIRWELIKCLRATSDICGINKRKSDAMLVCGYCLINLYCSERCRTQLLPLQPQ